RALKSLALAIGHVIALLCPEVIVIGGGVSNLGDQLFRPLRTAIDEIVFPPFAGLTEIRPAHLGEPVVLHGAILLAAQGLVRS
ncbi:MAG: ROK family protein, partial [Gemmataceae bacterium]